MISFVPAVSSQIIMSFAEKQPLLPINPSSIYSGNTVEVIVDSVPVATPIIVPVVESKDNEFGENYVNIDPADIPSICISWFLCLVPVNLSDISINIDYPYTSILLDSIKSILREKPNVSQSILDSLQINTVII